MRSFDFGAHFVSHNNQDSTLLKEMIFNRFIFKYYYHLIRSKLTTSGSTYSIHANKKLPVSDCNAFFY